jgi:hypothetical protein
LIAAVENHFRVTIGKEDLRKSIKVYNRTRELFAEFEMLRTRDDPACTGAEALGVLLAGTAMPREEYNALLEEYIKEAGNASGISGKTRVLLGGSACDDIELVKLVEGSGALVVADNVCFGSGSMRAESARRVIPSRNLPCGTWERTFVRGCTVTMTEGFPCSWKGRRRRRYRVLSSRISVSVTFMARKTDFLNVSSNPGVFPVSASNGSTGPCGNG